MNEKLTRLAERREYLINQAAKQRTALTHEAVPWRSLMEHADQGLAVVRYLKNHPMWLVGATGALFTALGPGRVWRWLGRGLIGLQMLNRLRNR